jgi:hypothetical protein
VDTLGKRRRINLSVDEATYQRLVDLSKRGDYSSVSRLLINFVRLVIVMHDSHCQPQDDDSDGDVGNQVAEMFEAMSSYQLPRYGIVPQRSKHKSLL